MVVAAQTESERPGRRLRWLAVGIVVLCLIVFAVWSTRDDSVARVEREHSVVLPDSARDLQVMGDASHRILRLTGLDRGASTIMLIDRTDLDGLLEQFGFEQEFEGGPFGPGAPGNAQYQPDSVPWAGDEAKEAAFVTDSPPGSGDWASIEVFGIDEETVAVWLYTDWN